MTATQDLTGLSPSGFAIVEEAQREATQARTAARELRRRIAAGDEDVTGADLAEADAVVELRQLRVEAAVARAREVTGRERAASLAGLQGRVVEDLAGDFQETIAPLFTKAVEALTSLADACTNHDEQLTAATVEARVLEAGPADGWTIIDNPGGPPRTLVVGGTVTVETPPVAFVAAAVRECLAGRDLLYGQEFRSHTERFAGAYDRRQGHVQEMGGER